MHISHRDQKDRRECQRDGEMIKIIEMKCTVSWMQIVQERSVLSRTYYKAVCMQWHETIMTMIALFVARLGASDCNQNNRIC